MARTALINADNVIDNIVLLDDGIVIDTPGFTQVNVDSLKDATIGDTLSKGVLTKYVPPPPTADQAVEIQDDSTLAVLKKSLDQFDSGNADPKLVAQAVAILIRDVLRRGLMKSA